MVENGENAEVKRDQAITNTHQWRNWAGLHPELLALIFARLNPTDEMIRTIPLVCWPWCEVINGPDFWAQAHVDLDRWCRHVARTAVIDSAVRKLIRRSSRTLRSLDAYMIGDAGFLHACSAGKFLRVLKIPMSVVTDQMVEKHAQFLPMLTVLDISYCLKITSKGIEALGNCCKSLVELRRNMPPPNHMADQDNGVGNAADESEAMSIADTMHNIEHLELAYGRFSDHGLDAILSKCRGLRVLDLRGCWNCKIEGKIESKCSLIQSVRGPWEIDNEDPDSSDDEGDDEEEQDDDDDDDDDSDIALVDVDTSEDYDDDDDGYD